MEKNKNILIGVAVVVVAALLFGSQLGLFSSINGKEITRSVPSVVSPGQTFTLSYISSGISGNWGASIQDSVSGGCTFPSGSTTYKTVMLSDDGSTKSIQIIAPQNGTCLFTGGDFKFGIDAIGQMADKVVTISGTNTTICSAGQTKCEGTTSYTCSNSDWQSQGLIDGKCGYTGITDEPTTPPTFELGMVLFKLGTFSVTLLTVLIAVGGLFIIKLVFSK